MGKLLTGVPKKAINKKHVDELRFRAQPAGMRHETGDKGGVNKHRQVLYFLYVLLQYYTCLRLGAIVRRKLSIFMKELPTSVLVHATLG